MTPEHTRPHRQMPCLPVQSCVKAQHGDQAHHMHACECLTPASHAADRLSSHHPGGGEIGDSCVSSTRKTAWRRTYAHLHHMNFCWPFCIGCVTTTHTLSSRPVYPAHADLPAPVPAQVRKGTPDSCGWCHPQHLRRMSNTEQHPCADCWEVAQKPGNSTGRSDQ